MFFCIFIWRSRGSMDGGGVKPYFYAIAEDNWSLFFVSSCFFFTPNPVRRCQTEAGVYCRFLHTHILHPAPKQMPPVAAGAAARPHRKAFHRLACQNLGVCPCVEALSGRGETACRECSRYTCWWNRICEPKNGHMKNTFILAPAVVWSRTLTIPERIAPLLRTCACLSMR